MPECSPDKSQQYERLRSQAIDDCRIPGSATTVSAAVLLRQGMGVWMQLRGTSKPAPSLEAVGTKQRPSTLPVPMHAELLAVLTGLVFNICSKKESA